MEDEIIPAIPLPRLERGSSRLLFAYSLYGVPFPISSQIATDLLENFRIFLAKNGILQNSKSCFSKLVQLTRFHG